MILIKIISFATLLFYLSGCGQNNPSPQKIDNKNKLTAGVVQASITKNMPSSKVIEALGSPNMITQDEDGNEVWVYDRVSSRIDSKSSGAGLFLLFINANDNGSSTESSQSTLTIIIKFDKDKKVKSFSYRQSRF